MRQFNQLGKVLGKLLADLFEPDNNASASQTIENINQELTTILDIDLEAIISHSTNELIPWFENEFEATFSNFEDLAEFLYQIGHLFLGQNDNNKSKVVFERALVVYEYLQDNQSTFSIETHQRIQELSDFLTEN
jgi:hypothetical protein